MPRRSLLFGRTVPRYGARRLGGLFLAFSLFVVCSLFLIIPGTTQVQKAAVSDGRFSMGAFKGSISKGMDVLNPFRTASHPPPRQHNDTFEGSSWWSNWKWRLPFSSSVTFDEDRSLLPPLPHRQTIYCYFDASLRPDAANLQADIAVLLTWKRAWWARGFRPVILGPLDAMNHPRYETYQARNDINHDLKTDIFRWLAWEGAGGGLLSRYTTIPLAASDDLLLQFLRRGEYNPRVETWLDTDDGLLVAPKAFVTPMIIAVLENPDLSNVNSVAQVSESIFREQPTKALACYGPRLLEKSYPTIAQRIKEGEVAGLQTLDELINAHLHMAWQHIFRDGISIVQPASDHTSAVISGAMTLARTLAQCAQSPASSCPPGLPSCKPCSGSRQTQVLVISTRETVQTASTVYAIGVVPHPYTFAKLRHDDQPITIPWIRRESKRNPWISLVTKDVCKDDRLTAPVVLFKDLVASDSMSSRSLWVVAETALPDDLSWHFGFALPKLAAVGQDNLSSDSQVKKEQEILAVERKELLRGKPVGQDKGRAHVAMEAWNLADVEAWKFVRAFSTRQTMERLDWNQHEARFAPGVGTAPRTAK